MEGVGGESGSGAVVSVLRLESRLLGRRVLLKGFKRLV